MSELPSELPASSVCGAHVCTRRRFLSDPCPFFSEVFGAHPLETVVRACRGVLVGELEAALAQQAPPQAQDDPTLHELPPVVMDGIPTPIEKMTQVGGPGRPWSRKSTRSRGPLMHLRWLRTELLQSVATREHAGTVCEVALELHFTSAKALRYVPNLQLVLHVPQM